MAVDLSKRIGIFKFLSAVANKGESARWHIGMTVQEVAELFFSYGLDPWKYGFMCFDSWSENDEDVSYTGDRFSFRTEELLLFIAAGINERLLRLENI